MQQLKTVIRGTAYFVGTAWSVAAAIAGLQFDGVAKKILGLLPLFVVLLFTLWDRWAWRWRKIVRFSGLPDLNGTWLGYYDAEWTDADAKRHKQMAPAALFITQTYTTLSITLATSESKSYSIFAHVTKLPSGEFRVNYEYDNTPNLQHRERMPKHVGSAQLTIATPRGAHLSGEYWTNRMSRGTLNFDWVSRSIVNTFDAATGLDNNISERDS